MKVTDKTRIEDRVWRLLVQDPEVIRSIFEAYHYKAPWMGWAPMLCEICRQVKAKATKERS